MDGSHGGKDERVAQWEAAVLEFLDELTNPEVYGWTCGEEARKRAAELRDGRVC